MVGDLSILRLILQASPVVQFVIALLLLGSLMSWAIIFDKRMVVRRASTDAERFENSFWSGGDLSALFRTIESRGRNTGMESIFEFGFREFARLRQQDGAAADRQAFTQRSRHRALRPSCSQRWHQSPAGSLR